MSYIARARAAVRDLAAESKAAAVEQSPPAFVKSVKKVAAIHDLSGFGRCSLTVIMPILSAMGVQVCPVPTAILSTHTGGFDNMVFKDLTDFILPCYEHYRRIDVEFDAIYSGFLASSEQIDGCLEFFRGYDKALKIVDPVMGDNGKPYKTYTPELCRRMSELAKVADIITPNLTETAILLGEDYRSALSPEMLSDKLERLCEYAEIAVITGVLVNGEYVNAGYERNSGEFVRVEYEHIPVHYPGTGDIFAGVLTGSLLAGEDLQTAIKRATCFSQKAVKTTHEFSRALQETGGNYENRNGVMFEGLLGELINL